MKKKKRTNCRLCNSQSIDLCFSFPLSPIADSYAESKFEFIDKYPQDLYICNQCGHVQILDVLPAEVLFGESYSYRPSRNSTLSDHWVNYADKIISKLGRIPDKVLDIGSNDGSLLRALKNRGSKVCVGVEPVRPLTSDYSAHGLFAVNHYWSDEISTRLLNSYGTFDLVCANNVFAHCDNLKNFVEGINKILGYGGLFSTEFSYLNSIINNGLIGTFFHEHLSHHHLLSLIPFLSRNGLWATDVYEVASQGGSLILTAEKELAETSKNVDAFLELEKKVIANADQIHKKLSQSILRVRDDFLSLFQKINTRKNRLVLFGASRSANLIVDFLGVRSRVDVILDSNPTKIGKYFYESGAQIIDTKEFKPHELDIVMITAWTQTSVIEEQLFRIYGKTPYFSISLYPSVTCRRN